MCVCVHQQNVKLLLVGLRNSGVSFDRMNTYKDCIVEIDCKSPTAKCYLNMCENCPGVERLKKDLELLFESSEINEIKFQMWRNIDRSTLRTENVSNKETTPTRPHRF